MLIPPENYVKTVPEKEFEKQRKKYIDHMCYRARTTEGFFGLIVCDTYEDVEEIINHVNERFKEDDNTEFVLRSGKHVELSNKSQIEARPYNKNIRGINTSYTLCAVRDVRPIDTYMRYVQTRASYADVNDMFSSEQGKTILLVPDTIEDVVADLIEQGSHTEI